MTSTPNRLALVMMAVSKAIRACWPGEACEACLQYGFDDKPSASEYVADVRYNHRRASCVGDPKTAPHLFTECVDRQSGAMSTDAKTTGAFQPLQ